MSVHCEHCGQSAGYGYEIGHRSDCPTLRPAPWSAPRKTTIDELEKMLKEDDTKVDILPNGEISTRPKTEADYAADREADRRESIAAARREYVARFELSEAQQKTLARLVSMEPGWHFASIVVRSGGKDHSFDATWLRPILKAIGRGGHPVGTI